MVSKKQIDDFMASKNVAVVGLSRNPKSFSRSVADSLREKGFKLFGVNPNAENINGVKCYNSIGELPAEADRLLILTSKAGTETIMPEVVKSRFSHIWIQQTADTPKVLEMAADSDKNIISGKCIMMFSEPVNGIHGFHKFLMKLFGKYPK
ncbi:MAG: CoA-binding protein [Candidatus Kapaibacterium sp.]